MDLKDFISQTLVQINEGVKDAQAKTKSNHAERGYINPTWGGVVSSDNVEKVQFDVAVTVADKTTGAADAGIKVVSIGIGGNIAKTSEAISVSRIQFSVPVVFPTSTIE